MRCLYPRTVGFKADGKTISWSEKEFDPSMGVSFQLPCSKCIECRLEYARNWAVRCTHEAKMYEDNSFITLTYSEEHLKSDKLIYKDFQDFMKGLREAHHQSFLNFLGEAQWQKLSKNEKSYITQELAIPFKVTGEYGDRRKRPHWHALLFNWRPKDLKPKYKNENGDQVYSSESLDALWGKGTTEVGQITFQSAGYVMRYAAKKLIHGSDQNHNYQPISKGSQQYAIGKKYLQKYYQQIFTQGHVTVENGTKCSIPRYYEKWLLKEHPKLWEAYVTQIKSSRISKAEERSAKEKYQKFLVDYARAEQRKIPSIAKHKVREQLITKRFERLQSFLKGDL